MSMLEWIAKGKFPINVEFTPHNPAELKHIAEMGRGFIELNKKYADAGIVFSGVSLTQNPGGSLSYDHQASIRILQEEGFPEALEICPHITGKDMNVDAICSLLMALADRGVGHVLALTGDLSAYTKGVFEVDSLGLLQLIKDINIQILKQHRDAESFAKACIIEAGAAVSPYKYTDGSLQMQYIKARKKVQEGARFLTLQCGWDAERAEQLIAEIQDIGVPILGNALVATQPVAKYMQTLPGCIVPETYLAALEGTKLADALERAGQQIAMFRQLGYAGVDLGKPGEFKKLEHVEKVIDTALAIPDWRKHRANIHFPVEDQPDPRVKKSASLSMAFHNFAFEKDGTLYPLLKTALKPVEKSYHKEGALYSLFNNIEGFGKGLLYHCEHCGDCFLPDNDFVCTMGECEKGLDNPPCGDADRNGICGNNPNRVCVGETLYHRLVHHGDLQEFTQKTRPHRLGKLEDSASILNYFFERDHAAQINPLKGSGLVQIAELLHATIPLPGAAMQYMLDIGDEAFARPNRGKLYVEHLIENQAKQGADYIDINIDALGDENPPELMRRYVQLVQKKSMGTPPCIDSSNQAVLRAGLQAWFECGDNRPPLVNSLPYMEKEKSTELLAMRKARPFSIICLLVGNEGPLKNADAMLKAALEMHALCRDANFQNHEIFFDCVTLGIASDGCMDGMGEIKPSHTHHAFQAIQQITNHPKMQGVHAVLGVSNWVYGAKKRRIGHIRAFIAAAQKRGLDAAIVDVDKQFGIKPAAPELVEFVEMFAGLDGSDESMMTYSATMQKARENNWI